MSVRVNIFRKNSDFGYFKIVLNKIYLILCFKRFGILVRLASVGLVQKFEPI